METKQLKIEFISYPKKLGSAQTLQEFKRKFIWKFEWPYLQRTSRKQNIDELFKFGGTK